VEDEGINDKLNEYLTQKWKPVLRQAGRYYMETIGQILDGVFNNFIKYVPVTHDTFFSRLVDQEQKVSFRKITEMVLNILNE
jgi:hypothetical protein